MSPNYRDGISRIRVTPVLVWLVALGWLGNLVLGIPFTIALDLSRAAVSGGALHRMVTYSLPHGSLFHCVFIAAIIAVYGFLLEPRIGSFRILVATVGGVLVLGLIHLVAAPPYVAIIGGSGIAFALIGSWVLYWILFRSTLLSGERRVGAIAAVIGVLLSLVPTYYSVWIGQTGSFIAGAAVVWWLSGRAVTPCPTELDDETRRED